MKKEDIQREVDNNYEAFNKILPNLSNKSGKFALMRTGKIVNFYDTFADAFSTGNMLYTDELFSVQKVRFQPVNLGYFSYALRVR